MRIFSIVMCITKFFCIMYHDSSYSQYEYISQYSCNYTGSILHVCCIIVKQLNWRQFICIYVYTVYTLTYLNMSWFHVLYFRCHFCFLIIIKSWYKKISFHIISPSFISRYILYSVYRTSLIRYSSAYFDNI